MPDVTTVEKLVPTIVILKILKPELPPQLLLSKPPKCLYGEEVTSV
jgi:hypothetical protein